MTGFGGAPASTQQIELHYLGMTWRIGGAAPTVAPVSSTAIGTALTRAAHTRLDPDPLIDDEWGDRLVPDSARAAHRALAVARLRERSPGTHKTPDEALDLMLLSGSGFTNIITRARYTEDALWECVANGIRQYVILGAGFDSFGLRRPRSAADVAVFEIDRPATQALKRRRLEECGIAVPPNLHFLAADLSTDDLGVVLARSPYRGASPAFYSWLGVTMFLTREANLATFSAIAKCSAAGSEVVFTYLDNRIFDSDSERFFRIRESVKLTGEPLQSGFDPDRLESDLRRAGLDLIQDLSEEQLVGRYSRTGRSFMDPLEHSRIARARVRG